MRCLQCPIQDTLGPEHLQVVSMRRIGAASVNLPTACGSFFALEASSDLKIRRSTNRLCGEVSTTVDVGSDASSGSHRMDFRVEILPISNYWEPSKPMVYWHVQRKGK